MKELSKRKRLMRSLWRKTRMRKIRKRMISLLFMFILFMGMNLNVMASGECKILQNGICNDKIISYIDSQETVLEVKCQIGMTAIDNVEVSILGEEAFHTIIMVDNSLSVTGENAKKITEFLEKYVTNKKENEYISIATFGEDVHFLVQKIQEQEKLLETVNIIESKNQDTYLTDVLYELLDDISFDEYTRFIIITDGVDNKQIGITKEELIEELKENTHPIYAIGHIYKNNEAQLENFFAFSRLTGGKEFLLDSVTEMDRVITEINDVSNVVQIKAEIPQELMDGSEKAVLFSIMRENSTSELVTEIRLPFTIKENEKQLVEESMQEVVAEEPVVEKQETEEIAQEEIVTEEVKTEKEKTNFTTYILWAVIIVAIVLLSVISKKPKEINKKAEKKKRTEPMVEIPIVIEEKSFEEAVDDDATVMMDGRYLLVLKDVKDNSKIFKYPMDEKIIIGRNVDKAHIVIDYNRAVSGQHCEIYTMANRFFIKDLNSANHTYVNQKVCIGETEIFQGCTIKLGDLELEVEMVSI